MHNFVASPNSRFFIYQIEKDILFTRGDRVLWKKSIAHDNFRILGIGNNGSIAVLTSEGIQIYGVIEQDPSFVDAFSQKALSEKSAFVGQILFNENGTQFCLDRIAEESKLTGKIFGALGAVPPEKSLKQHEIIFYSIADRNHVSYYKTQLPRDMEKKFRWSISKDFNFIVIGEPQKTGKTTKIRFQVVHVHSYEAYQEFMIPDLPVSALLINNLGLTLLDCVTGEKQEIQLISQDGQKFSVKPPAVDYEVLHLGRNYVAFLTRGTPALYIKSFDDILLCHADFSSLYELKIPFSLFFNSKDEIDILYMVEGEPKVLSSDIDRISIDAKRWELLAKQVRDSASAAPEPAREEKDRKRLTMEGAKEKKTAIALPPAPEIPAVPARPAMGSDPLLPGNESDLTRQLENLKLQFVIGQLSEDSYKCEKERIERTLAHLKAGKADDGDELGEKPAISSTDRGGSDKEKVEKLLEKLEERFVFGEMSEESYKELKTKYTAKLQSLSS